MREPEEGCPEKTPPSDPQTRYPNPRDEDVMAGDRRISRPDTLLPDWEIPDAAYRPIPIVWFTGALLLQMFGLAALAAVLVETLEAIPSGQSGWVLLAMTAAFSLAVGMWTWDRGMRSASRGWRIATALMMIAQWSVVALAVGLRL